eukprot:2498256-Alexandrium_andersonii.AAC.1
MRRCGRGTCGATRPPAACHCWGSWSLHQLSKFRQDFWRCSLPPHRRWASAPRRMARHSCGGYTAAAAARPLTRA